MADHARKVTRHVIGIWPKGQPVDQMRRVVIFTYYQPRTNDSYWVCLDKTGERLGWVVRAGSHQWEAVVPRDILHADGDTLNGDVVTATESRLDAAAEVLYSHSYNLARSPLKPIVEAAYA